MGSVASKWDKTKVLFSSEGLSRNIPETRKYSKSTLKTMLYKYKMVYVKPNIGSGGRGVMRVDKLGQLYKYQLNVHSWTFNSFDKMANSIDKKTENCSYIIQQGVHLLRYRSRPFDLRIMVQKNRDGEWKTTGIIGRSANPKKIVTNVCQGGTSVPVEVLLKKHVSNATDFIHRLRSLGKRTAKYLEKSFPRLKEIGLDVGIDQTLNTWIIEANTRPAIYGFKTLKDKSIYQKMCRYQRAYRRH